MSVISNIHTATIYEPKTSRALHGQRLVKIVAKADKDGNYGPHLQQTQCVSIPLLDPKSLRAYLIESSALDAHILTMLEDVQKSLISDKVKSGIKTVTSEELEIPALLNYLDASGDSDKWDSQRIAQWFEDNIAESLAMRLIEVGNDDEQMARKLVVAQNRFAESLSSKARIKQNVCDEVNKMLTFASDKDAAIYKRFYARVNPEIKVSENLEDSLGF
jgi:hypothetical protein